MSLIDNLRMLNRKERFFLICEVMGKPAFQLSPQFKDSLQHEFGRSIPDDAFVAMDYHLNWLYAALVLTYCPEPNDCYSNGDVAVEGNQEDVDLLIAWMESEVAHVLMIEAKGVTYFGNPQMESKANRLKMIFAADGARWKGVHPHFLLMSPRRPSMSRLRTSKIPDWMLMKDKETFHWIPMTGLDRKVLKTVTRCDENRHPSSSGRFWTLTEG
ncbi:MAG: hypothetical protein GX604_08290 [Actinobacteria bacterium]|nr:hypothetical protein [Actinomycetota bacterium]